MREAVKRRTIFCLFLKNVKIVSYGEDFRIGFRDK